MKIIKLFSLLLIAALLTSCVNNSETTSTNDYDQPVEVEETIETDSSETSGTSVDGEETDNTPSDASNTTEQTDNTSSDDSTTTEQADNTQIDNGNTPEQTDSTPNEETETTTASESETQDQSTAQSESMTIIAEFSGVIDNNSFEAIVEGGDFQAFRGTLIADTIDELNLENYDLIVITYSVDEDGRNIVSNVSRYLEIIASFSGAIDGNSIECLDMYYPMAFRRIGISEEVSNAGIEIGSQLMIFYYIDEAGSNQILFYSPVYRHVVELTSIINDTSVRAIYNGEEMVFNDSFFGEDIAAHNIQVGDMFAISYYVNKAGENISVGLDWPTTKTVEFTGCIDNNTIETLFEGEYIIFRNNDGLYDLVTELGISVGDMINVTYISNGKSNIAFRLVVSE